jgi:predicted amidophosphoribosyltransferase
MSFGSFDQTQAFFRSLFSPWRNTMGYQKPCGTRAAQSAKLEDMERICSQCRAVLAKETQADWCPACGGALLERATLPVEDHPTLAPPQVDHRGIVLPRRHAVGGIITPQ